ncbi:MAG: GntR family transcriptional regulator [Candidatus Latescibacteria bacterium]|nr:GntR family transcriptional regulator [Candidatus Latescibacterota bacterium]NIO28462.1 GntR family transcriptional regulator [Candidatus Latescibacterota bacterium]NIO56011.1 GntR family transcriptional regulator [Candidatus Latescibacterota bacterium]NIT01975.1 GntR family transcriptional regulator [Candidatus Latescibacterota bacterium]
MLIIVDPHSGVPVYRQLMDQIKFHITTGLLKPGDELPSTRTLSSELGVNPMTISKAYSFLEREDVVERRPGRPLVVKSLPGETIKDKKMDQLKESLSSTVTMVKQLGIEYEEALKTFRELLEDKSDATAHYKEDDK